MYEYRTEIINGNLHVVARVMNQARAEGHFLKDWELLHVEASGHYRICLLRRPVNE